MKCVEKANYVQNAKAAWNNPQKLICKKWSLRLIVLLSRRRNYCHKTLIFFPTSRKKPTLNGSSPAANSGYLTLRREGRCRPLSTSSQLPKGFITYSSGCLWKSAAGPTKSKKSFSKRWVILANFFGQNFRVRNIHMAQIQTQLKRSWSTHIVDRT